MTELESGAVKNEKVTTYTGKDKEGKDTVETITKDKDTGEVKREIDGKEVDQPQQYKYAGSNFEPLMIVMMNNILNQLKEMNYYMSYLEPKDKDNG